MLAAAPAVRALPRVDAVAYLTAYLVALFVIPSRLIFGPLGAAGTPAMVIAILGLVWWAVHRIDPPDGPVRTGFQPVRWATIGFALAVLASYASLNLHPQDAETVNGADRGLLLVAGVVGVCFLAADGIDSRDRLEVLLRRIVIAGGILAAAGIVEFFSGLDLAQPLTNLPGLVANHNLAAFGTRSSFRRVAVTAAHPIEFSVVLATIFPLAVQQALGAARGATFWPWLRVGLIAVAVPMTVSRSGIVGLAVGVVVLATTWSWTRIGKALVLTAVFTTAVYLLVPGLLGTIRSFFVNFSGDPSIQHRTQDYDRVGGFVLAHPLLGTGFNTFDPTKFFFLDNQYLGVVIELGAVGMLAITVLMLTAIFTARGARRRSSDPLTREMGQALAASAAVLAVCYVTFDALGFPMITGLTFLIFGCCGALWRLAREGAT